MEQIIIIEFLVRQSLVVIDNQIVVNSFEDNATWMQNGIDGLSRSVILKLHADIAIFWAGPLLGVHIIDSPTIGLVFMFHMQGNIRAFAPTARRNNVEASVSLQFFRLEALLKRWWVDATLKHIDLVGEILLPLPLVEVSWAADLRFLSLCDLLERNIPAFGHLVVA